MKKRRVLVQRVLYMSHAISLKCFIVIVKLITPRIIINKQKKLIQLMEVE